MRTAPLHSALAGLLAGFAFTGLTVVLAVDQRRDRRDRPELRELFLAFIVLVVASFQFGILGGEPDGHVLLRPTLTFAFASIVLAVGGLQMVAALYYLLLASSHVGRADDESERAFRVGYHLVATLVAYQLVITAADAIEQAYFQKEASAGSLALVLAIAAAGVVGVLGQRPPSWSRHSDATPRERSWWTPSWLRVFVALVLLDVAGFALTFSAPPDSAFVTYGEFGGLVGALYTTTLVASTLAALLLALLQGWRLASARSWLGYRAERGGGDRHTPAP